MLKQSQETMRVPMQQQLPPIFERSFETSEMASSLGAMNDYREHHSFGAATGIKHHNTTRSIATNSMP